MIDEYRFETYYRQVLRLIESESGLVVESFTHPYLEDREGYKYDIYSAARKLLRFGNWKEGDVGTGKILSSTVSAITIEFNNLVRWRRMKGGEQHKVLERVDRTAIEALLFPLFRSRRPERDIFEGLINVIGRKYPLVAYLFFLKDRTRFMPISPRAFDQAFEKLGSDLTTSRRCSWDNYAEFNAHLSDIRALLVARLGDGVSLLDAHTFGYILGDYFADDPLTVARLSSYEEASPKDREAVIKARIGQGMFRDRLLTYWASCAITGCREKSLLVASHIKPWRVCDHVREALDPFNGLLLSPNLDAAFDGGWITFSNAGEVIVSPDLDAADAATLGLTPDMRLARTDERHHRYLDYHRKCVFRTTA